MALVAVRWVPEWLASGGSVSTRARALWDELAPGCGGERLTKQKTHE